MDDLKLKAEIAAEIIKEKEEELEKSSAQLESIKKKRIKMEIEELLLREVYRKKTDSNFAEYSNLKKSESTLSDTVRCLEEEIDLLKKML